MALAPMGTLQDHPGLTSRPAPPRPPRTLGIACLTIGTLAAAAWVGWRTVTLELHPVALAFFAAELAGIVAAICVGVGLLNAAGPCDAAVDEASDDRDCHRFADTVTDLVGRTPCGDVHRDVRVALRAAPRWRPRGSADTAVAAVIAEGPRRLVLVVVLAVGLLVGAAPFPPPPLWAIGAAALGYGSFAVAHVALGQRRVRFGDRQRWSYGSIGEIVARSEVAGHATRSWTGALGVTVALSVTVALRGMSDRWTHGLPEMSYEHRVAAFTTAIVFVLGALYTMTTTRRPAPTSPHLVSRRLEESTARQSLVVAAIVVGLVGLVAGAVPNGNDSPPASEPAAPVQRVAAETEPVGDDG